MGEKPSTGDDDLGVQRGFQGLGPVMARALAIEAAAFAAWTIHSAFASHQMAGDQVAGAQLS